LELNKISVKIYAEDVDAFYSSYLESINFLLEKGRTEKNDFLQFLNLLPQLGGRHSAETKNKFVNVLNQFTSLIDNDISLTYEEKFSIIREESLNKMYRFFASIKVEGGAVTHGQFNSLKSFLEAVVDPVTFDRLFKRDQLFFENIIFKISQGAKRDALDLLQKVDVRR
jgi:hypothetical protein